MSAQKGVETEVCRNGGMNVTGLKDGDWIKISGVDFGLEAAKKFTANLVGNGTSLELRLGSETGKLIGTLTATDAKNFKSLSCTVDDEVTGKHDLFIVVKGNGTNPLKIDWWKFATK